MASRKKCSTETCDERERTAVQYCDTAAIQATLPGAQGFVRTEKACVPESSASTVLVLSEVFILFVASTQPSSHAKALGGVAVSGRRA